MGILKIMVVFICFAVAPAYSMPVLGTNVIVNGDAESGSGSLSGTDVLPVPGWSTTGNFTVVRYDASMGFPSPTDPGPSNRGNNFFAGGPTTTGSSAQQIIDVSFFATLIDLGQVSFDLSGHLGGYFDQEDNAVLRASFLTTTNAILGTASIGPVTVGHRNTATGLLFRSVSGTLPSGTRSIDLGLVMTRVTGAFTDGYADNLSLILNGPSASVPEPRALTLLAIALVASLFRRGFLRS